MTVVVTIAIVIAMRNVPSAHLTGTERYDGQEKGRRNEEREREREGVGGG